MLSKNYFGDLSMTGHALGALANQSGPLTFPDDFSISGFYNSPVSNMVGYFPAIGTAVGLGRIAFTVYLMATEPYSRELRDRCIAQLVRGVLETFALGIALAVYDLIQKIQFAPSLQAMTPFQALFDTSQARTIGTAPEASIELDRFTQISSHQFADHAPQLVAFYHSKPPQEQLLQQYAGYRSQGNHALRNQQIFAGADFYTRHGIMHSCFVAQMIPHFIQHYRDLGHAEALAMTQEDIAAMQVVGFLHDYGRIALQDDLGRDSPRSEMISQHAARDYLVHVMGFAPDRAERFARAITSTHMPMNAEKPLFAQILQSADSLAIHRADDWQFDHRHIDAFRWIDLQVAEEAQRINPRERIFQIADAAKLFLVDLGDSPHNATGLSAAYRGQAIAGQFSLETKRQYETSPQCYQLMADRLRRFLA